MSVEKLKPNERRMWTYLLTQLERQIYLQRISLYGDSKNYFKDGSLVTEERLEMNDGEFETTFNLPPGDYQLMVDSCEIETYINRVIHGLDTTPNYSSLDDVNEELENESTIFKKHQKMIDAKKREIEHLKNVLPILKEQADGTVKHLQTLDAKADIEETVECFDDVEFLKKLMKYKLESKYNYQVCKMAELKENIEDFERETRTQEHANVQALSFWLLKYDANTENLDWRLKDMFDKWTAKRRELNILRKYRRLNRERIQKLNKSIHERDEVIKQFEAEKEQQRIEELLRRMNSATTIQAWWRGVMVRRYLGPYKILKPKKKKGKGKKK